MNFITKKTWQNNGVGVIVFDKEKWLNEKHISQDNITRYHISQDNIH